MNATAGLSIVVGVAVLCAMSSLALAGSGTPEPPAPPSPTWAATPPPADVAMPPGLPAIGKWMIDPTGAPAHWLGEIYRGKALREPINVLIVDSLARSVEDAKQRLVTACQKAGYPARTGHSSGYQGYIGGTFYAQLPEQTEHAFSNGPFELDNNHGRVFGPAQIDGSYTFIAAFSRENVDPITKVKHRYASFDRARDDFTQRLDEFSDYKITGFVNLDNALIDDPKSTTGDHDGIAVLLTAAR
jgi:hypothetical protein